MTNTGRSNSAASFSLNIFVEPSAGSASILVEESKRTRHARRNNSNDVDVWFAGGGCIPRIQEARSMTPTQFKQARRSLGLSATQLGHILNSDPRTVRRGESEGDARPVNPIVVQWILDGFRPPEWPQ